MSTIKKKDKEYSIGRTAENTKVIGKMESNMVKVPTLLQVERLNMVSGKKEKDSNG